MNRHLPPNMIGDYSENGWQTEERFMRYIEQHLIPYSMASAAASFSTGSVRISPLL